MNFLSIFSELFFVILFVIFLFFKKNGAFFTVLLSVESDSTNRCDSFMGNRALSRLVVCDFSEASL